MRVMHLLYSSLLCITLMSLKAINLQGIQLNWGKKEGYSPESLTIFC